MPRPRRSGRWRRSRRPMMVRRPPSTAAMMTCTPTAMSITGAGRGGAHVEHQQRAGEAAEQRADAEGGQLVLGDVEAERPRLHRILSAGLQDQPEPASATRPNRITALTDGHEAEGEVVVEVASSIDSTSGMVSPISPPVQVGEDGHHLLQQQHRDQGHEAEIRPAQPQRRQRQHDAADHGQPRRRRPRRPGMMPARSARSGCPRRRRPGRPGRWGRNSPRRRSRTAGPTTSRTRRNSRPPDQATPST